MSDVLVLCYHALSPTWPAALSIEPDAFERQLQGLADRGYRGATVRQAIEEPPAEQTVAVTFDDAYVSVLDVARPILDRLGWPASVYVPSAWPERNAPMTWPGIDQWLGGPHEHELACMSWEQLRGLRSHGWEIGSHTRTHPRLPDLADAPLRDELAGSRADCEAGLGAACDTLAYPYGAVDERVVEAAGRAGYSYAVSLPSRLHAPRALCWPRVGVYHVDGEADWRWRLKSSRALRRLRASRAWEGLDGLRRRVSR
ncbi:MAG TPA: polysaccharide deacetylase family protein [Thermoleophilaceae bacterium]|nr:polysaccharide deacetylase family protein [Thermoleophilaceae bacterium]